MRSVPQSEVADRPFLWTRGVAASETLRYLDKNGVDVEAILSKAQLSRSQLSQESGGISVASQHRFLEFAAVETNDSLLGLHVAAEMDVPRLRRPSRKLSNTWRDTRVRQTKHSTSRSRRAKVKQY